MKEEEAYNTEGLRKLSIEELEALIGQKIPPIALAKVKEALIIRYINSNVPNKAKPLLEDVLDYANTAGDKERLAGALRLYCVVLYIDKQLRKSHGRCRASFGKC